MAVHAASCMGGVPDGGWVNACVYVPNPILTPPNLYGTGLHDTTALLKAEMVGNTALNFDRTDSWSYC